MQIKYDITTYAHLRAYALRLIDMHQENSMYTDAHIEHWAAIFVAHRLHFVLGITFEEFLERPAAFKHAAELAATAERLMLGDYAPLLPRQQRVRAALAACEPTPAPAPLQAAS